MRSWGVIAGLAVLVGLVAAVAGGSEPVACDTTSQPQRLSVQAWQLLGGGHYDGPTTTLCDVLPPVTWLVTTAATFVLLAAGLVLARSVAGSRGVSQDCG